MTSCSRSSSQKDGTFSFLPMDLSGKLIIKARLGEDIRRVPIHNEDITYDELLLMLQRVYKGKLNNTDDVTIKYCDEDGDLITIMDSSDLNLAKQLNRFLKITIFIHDKEPLPILDASKVQEMRNELIVIRNKVNMLLDVIDGIPKGLLAQNLTVVTETSTQGTPNSVDATAKKDNTAVEVNPSASVTMFDPLKPSKTGSGTSAANSSSTSHLFSHSSPNPGANAFLTSSSSSQSGYPSPQQSQQGYPGGVYSNSPSPSAPQAASPQQQVGSQPQQQVGNQPQPGSQQQQMGTQQQQGSQQQQQQQVGSQPDSSYYGYSQAYPTMGTQGPSASMYQPVMGYNYAYQAVPVPSSFPKQGQAYTQQGYSPYTM